jgi:hypothetical protein
MCFEALGPRSLYFFLSKPKTKSFETEMPCLWCLKLAKPLVIYCPLLESKIYHTSSYVLFCFEPR